MKLDLSLWLSRREEIAKMCEEGATCSDMAKKYDVSVAVMGQVLDAFYLKTFMVKLRDAAKRVQP